MDWRSLLNCTRARLRLSLPTHRQTLDNNKNNWGRRWLTTYPGYALAQHPWDPQRLHVRARYRRAQRERERDQTVGVDAHIPAQLTTRKPRATNPYATMCCECRLRANGPTHRHERDNANKSTKAQQKERQQRRSAESAKSRHHDRNRSPSERGAGPCCDLGRGATRPRN